MRILRPALILAAVFAAAALSEAATPLSPHECIEAALEHSYLLSQDRHLLAADRADITKKRGTTLPYVSGLIQGYELWGNPVSPFQVIGQVVAGNGVSITRNGRVVNPKANFKPIGIEQIGITYPLFYEGSILGLNDPPAVATAVATMNQQQLTALISAQQVILSVLTEYIYAISYREQVALQHQIVDADRKQLEIIHDQIELGIMLPYQAESARAQLVSAQQVLDSSRANLAAALFQLGTLMGTKDETPELAEAKLPLIELPALGPLLDKVMTVHPALRVQEATVEIAHQQLLVDRDVRLPNVTLNSALSTGQDLEYFNGSSAHSRPVEFLSYLNIEIPLYDFGQRHAASVESDERFQAARDGARQLEMTLRSSMKQSYSDILADEQTLADQQGIYASDEQALELARAQRVVSEINELALISAELSVLNARVLVVSDQMAELLKYAELQNLSGGTWRWLQ
jgi:outer membrane protein TolC